MGNFFLIYMLIYPFIDNTPQFKYIINQLSERLIKFTMYIQSTKYFCFDYEFCSKMRMKALFNINLFISKAFNNNEFGPKQCALQNNGYHWIKRTMPVSITQQKAKTNKQAKNNRELQDSIQWQQKNTSLQLTEETNSLMDIIFTIK